MNLLDIRRDEWSKVTLTWLMSALLAMGYTIGWSAIHSMLVKRLGVGFLPYSYIGIAVLGMLGSSIYLVFADRVRRDRLLIAFAAVTAMGARRRRACWSTGRSVGEAGFTPSLILFFTIVLLAQGVGNSTLGTQVWTVIGDVLRPGRARQLYPIIGTSGTVGGIIGGLSIGWLVKGFSTADLVVVWAISIACLIPLMLLIQARHGAELKGGGRRARAPPTGGKLANYREGWRQVTGSRLVQVISLIALMFWITGSLQDFQYTRIMNQTFVSEEALASYYGYYSIAFNVTGMVIQFGVAGYVLSRIGGVGRGLIVLPLTTTGRLRPAGSRLRVPARPGFALHLGHRRHDRPGKCLQPRAQRHPERGARAGARFHRGADQSAGWRRRRAADPGAECHACRGPRLRDDRHRHLGGRGGNAVVVRHQPAGKRRIPIPFCITWAARTAAPSSTPSNALRNAAILGRSPS